VHPKKISPAARSFLLFLLILVFYLVIIEYLIQHTSFALPLQLAETSFVSSTQGLFGIPVFSEQYSLFYPDKNLQLIVGPLCTGIREMFLFAIVILPFGALTLRKKLRSLAFFLPMILAENIARIWLLYPLANAYGVQTMNLAHDFVWTYGQIAFLVALLFLWFRFFGRPGVDKAGGSGKKDKGKKSKVK